MLSLVYARIGLFDLAHGIGAYAPIEGHPFPDRFKRGESDDRCGRSLLRDEVRRRAPLAEGDDHAGGDLDVREPGPLHDRESGRAAEHFVVGATREHARIRELLLTIDALLQEGSVTLAGLVRQLKYQTTGANAIDDSIWTAAGALSGKFNVFDKDDMWSVIEASAPDAPFLSFNGDGGFHRDFTYAAIHREALEIAAKNLEVAIDLASFKVGDFMLDAFGTAHATGAGAACGTASGSSAIPA